MKGIIDRFEGEIAILELENRERLELKREHLPREAKEGDVIVQIDGQYTIDQEETQRRIDEIEQLSQNLWE